MTSATEETGWTSKQAYGMAIICLVIGVVLGFLLHGPATPEWHSISAASAPSVTRPVLPPPSKPQPSPAEMKVASAQAAAPVLERLKSNPSDFKLLVEAGEMYYQHGAYAEAAGYYERALVLQDKVILRNQYASALFYMGDTDGALQQYANVLKVDPTNDVALFNSAMIKYKANNDAKGALELWEKLLKTHPNHLQRDEVEKMIDLASHSKG